MENFYFSNKELIDLYENYLMFPNSKIGEKALGTLKEILVYLGFSINKDQTIAMNKNNEIDILWISGIMFNFFNARCDYETFKNLRMKESFGKF